MGESTCSEVLHVVGGIVTTVDGPEESKTDHVAAGGAVADVRHQKSGTPRSFFERLIKERRVKEWEFAEQELGAVRFGRFTWDYIEARAFQAPPGVGHFAVGEKTLMQDIFFVNTLRPLSLEVVRIRA